MHHRPLRWRKSSRSKSRSRSQSPDQPDSTAPATGGRDSGRIHAQYDDDDDDDDDWKREDGAGVSASHASPHRSPRSKHKSRRDEVEDEDHADARASARVHISSPQRSSRGSPRNRSAVVPAIRNLRSVDREQSTSESDTPWFASDTGGPVMSGAEADHEEELRGGRVPVSSASQLLAASPPEKKWQNWSVRTTWTLIMVSLFFLILFAGHAWVVLLVVAIQLAVFREVIQIAHVPSKEKKLPWFRSIIWYFLGTTNYFLYGESVLYFYEHIPKFLIPLATHHRFISFSLYCIGLVFFVLNLKKGYYKFQFSQFAWTHMALLLVVVQSHAIINNIFEGLIWFFLPCSLVIVNDVFAYICGFFWGKTPLIKLSPKKTWEGFLGGALCTLLFGVIVSYVLIQVPYFICPVTDLSTSIWSGITCPINPVFLPQTYQLPSILPFIGDRTVQIVPVQLHTLVFSLFASSIAPFGGFFASGVKRAFKIKDFGDTIPGHGGITDRFDCQFMMGTFSFIYVTSFIGRLGTGDFLQRIALLSTDDKIVVYHRLAEMLQAEGILPRLVT